MTSLRKLMLVVVLGVTTICGAMGAALYVNDAPVLIADDPLPMPQPPWAV